MKDRKIIVNNPSKVKAPKPTSATVSSIADKQKKLQRGGHMAVASDTLSKDAVDDLKRQKLLKIGLILGGCVFIVLAAVQGTPPTKKDGQIRDLYLMRGDFGDFMQDDQPVSELIGNSTLTSSGDLTRPNPEIPIFERLLCTGRLRALGCSGKNYHPYIRWWEDHRKDKKISDYSFARAEAIIKKVFEKD